MRLQKILSSYGVSSRREAERLILGGRVLVNGIIAKTGQSAHPGIDEITVDGVPLDTKNDHIYIMLNKPRGYLSTVRDDRGRKTVMELLKEVECRVFPVGRLDMNSEGLLLFTNDGEFANAVMHPSHNIHKTYEVRVRGDIHKAAGALNKPVEIDEYTVHASKVELIQATPDGGSLIISIAEGRNRQVRKMCAACGLTVTALKRISVGRLELGDLENGKWRFLTEKEVQSIG